MFFLVYSIVRWQVNQDLETLREMPEWLRPTKTQLEIQHPLPLDFFIWPLIRNALVKLSQTNPAKAYEFLLTSCAFTQLDVDPASLLGSTEEDLLLTVSNINNWKLHPTFFEIYPEWRQLYEQHLKT
ncbi:hypothetical protein B0O99DRAFT_745891 [Neofusicoccum parvum]|uniref:Uncharacterized protein n=1 Tax=Neofusicoccum parvum TaxID=310453 RepID=A0ACB5SFC6_9PEZI|nr:hypothetical protein B0O99DRAFT_745891 [Neofusicoccum parvum]